MAPDAEQTRQLGGLLQEQQQRDLSLSDLSGDEIAIDDSVYSLDGFNHPGGEQIRLFGGNDVTVQYRMIHPRHKGKSHLNKLTRVGNFIRSDKGGAENAHNAHKTHTLDNPDNPSNEYQFDTPFEKELKDEVFKIVKPGKEFATPGYLARALFYIASYFGCLYLWMTQESTWTLAAIFGLLHALIGLNVQHDANHGAVAKKPFINDLLGFGVDLIGGSKWLWMEQHWTHHA